MIKRLLYAKHQRISFSTPLNSSSEKEKSDGETDTVNKKIKRDEDKGRDRPERNDRTERIDRDKEKADRDQNHRRSNYQVIKKACFSNLFRIKVGHPTILEKNK
jgi:hypothetical protein